MNRHSRRLRLLTPLLAFALVTAACGSDDDPAAEPETTAAPAETDAAEPAESDPDPGSDRVPVEDGLTLTVALDSDYAPTHVQPDVLRARTVPVPQLVVRLAVRHEYRR